MKRQVVYTFLVFYSLFTPIIIASDDPVYIPDPYLKEAIEMKLGITDPSEDEMLDLFKLVAGNSMLHGIQDLSGLEYAENITFLNLHRNQISNISPIRRLVNLETLKLSNNYLTSIRDLSMLTNLRSLNIHRNDITDIGVLAGFDLESLQIYGNEISDISALAGMQRLSNLQMSYNEISDIWALSGMMNLINLEFTNNNITDIKVISSMPKLLTLDADNNHIHDISPLSNLTRILTVKMSHNQVSDISPLIQLQTLKKLNICNNPLNKKAYSTHLQMILDNNPDIALSYDPNTHPPENITASQGLYLDKINISWEHVHNGPYYTSYYRVYRTCSLSENMIPVSPWQTMSTFDDVTAIPGITYYYYVRCATDIQGSNSGQLSPSDEGWLSYIHIIYVDNKTLENIGVDDPNENGTIEHPFDTIQEAIDMAPEGASILIRPGIYMENIDLLDKNNQLLGIDPNTNAFPVIAGYPTRPTMSITGGQDANSVLQNLIITGNTIGIDCNSSSPIIKSCIVTGNKGPGILCQESNAVIINCTVTGNIDGLVCENSQVSLSNCILWDNHPQSIMVASGMDPLINYSNIQGLHTSYAGEGNIDTDPLFADPGYWDHNNTPDDPNDDIWILGDYHLQSQTGRWDPLMLIWIQDNNTSPCIDAGDPADPIDFEPEPNGSIINMGAYGGTARASKSSLKQ